MPRKGFANEQIINHLREAQVLLTQGQRVCEICRQIEISEYTLYLYGRLSRCKTVLK